MFPGHVLFRASLGLHGAAVPTRTLHHVPEVLFELEPVVTHQRDPDGFEAGGLAALTLVALTPHVILPRCKVKGGQEIRCYYCKRVKGKSVSISSVPGGVKGEIIRVSLLTQAFPGMVINLTLTMML